jgi:hypothetical protein
VDNEEWQAFRVSLKGKSTKDKLAELKKYYHANIKLRLGGTDWDYDVFVRVDNYLKALARGGQIASTPNTYVVHLVEDRLVIRK